jgi:DNA/RNA-binding domain of Phe-tRNA-synthetase-like protein/DNA-binding PadR family transcriptional regulator
MPRINDDINATAACLLGLLQLGPAPGQPGFGQPNPAMTGSQLWRAAATSIARFWNVTRSQVFRELPRLDADRLVERAASGPRRQQPYRITPAGRQAFSRWLLNLTRHASRDEQLHSPLVLMVFFGELVPPSELKAALADHRRGHAERLAGLQRMQRVLGGSRRLPAQTVTRGLAYQALTIDWIDSVLGTLHSTVVEHPGSPVEVLPVALSDAWRAAFPGAHVGLLLVEGLGNVPPSTELLEYAKQIEGKLHARYQRADRATLTSLPTAQAYQRHYRSFGQTYHVLRQLESVVLKSKPIESPSGLVLAMFATEIDSLLLTAGHDADALRPPLVVDRSEAGERFVGIGGREHTLREGDMLMRDGAGIISAVIYGPDQRTRLVDDTRRVLFTTYGPAGVSVNRINHHLSRLAYALRLGNPSAVVRLQRIYPDEPGTG